MAGPLLRNNRQTTDSSSLEGHYVGVYFSAHWVSGKGRGDNVFFIFFILFKKKKSSLLLILSPGVKKGQQEETKHVVETDKREEQEGGWDTIVLLCLH